MYMIQSWLLETWNVSVQMAPYLALGFVAAALLRIVLPMSVVSRHLGGEGVLPVLKGVLLGIPLPLCSCGVLPVATSLRRSGAGRGPTMAFLTTTPVTGVDSVLATWALLGLPFTLARIAASAILGLWVGLLARFTRPSGTTDEVAIHASDEDQPHSLRRLLSLKSIVSELREVMAPLAGSLLIGLAIAGAIGAFFPPGLLRDIGVSGIGGILAASMLGIPLYVCATGSIPIAASLVMKGLSPGAALAFLVAGPATNAVAVASVKKMMGTKGTLLYVSVIFIGAVLSGIVIDAMGIQASFGSVQGATGHETPVWEQVVAGMLLLWAALEYGASLFEGMKGGLKTAGESEEDDEMSKKVLVEVPDMNCNHCKMTIERGLSELDEVMDVRIDMRKRMVEVTITDSADGSSILQRISSLGYTPVADRKE